MGEALHDIVKDQNNTRCRIYAPVGAHRDLLAYLVRRLLENGANSSFVNQIVDTDVPAEDVARDPFEALNDPAPVLARGPDLFQPRRPNSRGWDLNHAPTLAAIDAVREPLKDATWQAAPVLAGKTAPKPAVPVINPADATDIVGHVATASEADVETALSGAAAWSASPSERRAVLEKAADLYEAEYGAIFAILAREAGKSLA
ncbi:Bifunctional protein PutA [Nymphon striatum]|nr:Bifunctional protein PutA [Nymphon striatum]